MTYYGKTTILISLMVICEITEAIERLSEKIAEKYDSIRQWKSVKSAALRSDTENFLYILACIISITTNILDWPTAALIILIKICSTILDFGAKLCFYLFKSWFCYPDPNDKAVAKAVAATGKIVLATPIALVLIIRNTRRAYISTEKIVSKIQKKNVTIPRLSR